MTEQTTALTFTQEFEILLNEYNDNIQILDLNESNDVMSAFITNVNNLHLKHSNHNMIKKTATQKTQERKAQLSEQFDQGFQDFLKFNDPELPYYNTVYSIMQNVSITDFCSAMNPDYKKEFEKLKTEFLRRKKVEPCPNFFLNRRKVFYMCLLNYMSKLSGPWITSDLDIKEGCTNVSTNPFVYSDIKYKDLSKAYNDHFKNNNLDEGNDVSNTGEEVTIIKKKRAPRKEVPEEERCTSLTVQGKRCTSRAKDGGLCGKHSKTKQVILD